MKHNEWLDKKPEFTEECIMITAIKHNDKWDYSSWQIIQVEGYGEDGPGWYYALCEMDGEEWGDMADLRADLYLTMSLLK